MSRIEFQEVLKLAESNDRIMVAVTNQGVDSNVTSSWRVSPQHPVPPQV